MSQSPVIYSFEDPVDYLNFEFRKRQKLYAKFSLRAWSRQLGYENPSFLSHVLKKNRKLKIDLAQKIAENLGLSGKERKYFELMVLKTASSSEAEKKMFQRMITKVRPGNLAPQVEDFPVEKFELASEWYHWAIVEMFYLKDFTPTVDFISSRLGREVPKKKVRESLKKLIDLGFIEGDLENGFRRASDNPIFMKSFPSWAARMYHQAMMEKAKQSVEGVPFDRRNLRGTMIALTKEQYVKAVEIAAEAHKRILALSADAKADDVYHFGSQLFPVTVPGDEDLVLQ